jgi:SAM-dependent methyltransferase
VQHHARQRPPLALPPVRPLARPARASADGLTIEFREADAESLPFADGAFDAVVSTFGVMFTPNQDQAAGELLRVCRAGGKIGLANWTPEGFDKSSRRSASICRRQPERGRLLFGARASG